MLSEPNAGRYDTGNAAERLKGKETMRFDRFTHTSTGPVPTVPIEPDDWTAVCLLSGHNPADPATRIGRLAKEWGEYPRGSVVVFGDTSEGRPFSVQSASGKIGTTFPPLPFEPRDISYPGVAYDDDAPARVTTASTGEDWTFNGRDGSALQRLVAVDPEA